MRINLIHIAPLLAAGAAAVAISAAPPAAAAPVPAEKICTNPKETAALWSADR